jgi:FAD-dependent halogenase
MSTEEFEVIVCGGGPAGSTVSTLLAMKGHRVLLLEAKRFPRYHIGESLIPGGIQVLRESGVLPTVDRFGFVVKRGNTYVWGQNRDPWSIAFAEADIDVYAYQVERSLFDEILLRHARESGVTVREECPVLEPEFDRESCCGVLYASPTGERRHARALWTVDATGQACLMGRRLGIRQMDSVLNNVAIWSYFRGADRLPEPGAGYTLSAAVEDAWIWYIPLHDDRVSVGVVTGIEVMRRETNSSNQHIFESRIASSQLVSNLLSRAKRSDRLYTARDWSYCCKQFSGPGWLLIGDAAGFVDPILSTGCGLALQAAQAAAYALHATLCKSHSAMKAFDGFYQNYLGQFFDFVHYFYDANRHRESYYWQARQLTDPARNATARNAFIYLISGLNSAITEPGLLRRSFEMGVFDKLGTPLGDRLLHSLGTHRSADLA